ncbi:MAG TPA: glycoside hydrolase family 15 protein, partial [Acidimicrobiales bacterium]|nr:glycoside hydrolase family 15 protein [Acidimicrobiales bacterium]
MSPSAAGSHRVARSKPATEPEGSAAARLEGAHQASQRRSAPAPRTRAAAVRAGQANASVMPAPHVLRDYALLADGHRGVLVGPQGDCAWMCFPSWADPAIFATLIGSGGHYLVQPAGRWVWGGSYEDGTLIWTSRWVTENGTFECRDALAYPGAPDRAVLLRRVRALDSAGEVLVALDPRTDYGRAAVGPWRRQDAAWQARGSGTALIWWGAAAAAPRRVERHRRLELELQLAPGDQHDLVLEVVLEGSGRDRDGGEPPDAGALWELTERSWRAEVPACDGPMTGRDVRRSYAVLRGLTGPDGGTVAAATTSLPERANSNRNYDYRYVWVRDTCYVGRAGACLPGGEPMLDDAVRWVTARLAADGEHLAPAYLPDGGQVPPVEVLDLPGYPGGSDVIGNRIRDQFQLDAFGEALLLFAIAASRQRLTTAGWEAAEIAVTAIERRWAEPDSGIWELEPAAWTNSRLVCVAGLKAIGRAGAPPERAARYSALADKILAQSAS